MGGNFRAFKADHENNENCHPMDKPAMHYVALICHMYTQSSQNVSVSTGYSFCGQGVLECKRTYVRKLQFAQYICHQYIWTADSGVTSQYFYAFLNMCDSGTEG